MGLQSQLFRGDPKLEAAAVSDPAHIMLGASGPHVYKIQTALMLLDRAAIAADEMQRAFYGDTTASAVLAYKRKRDIVNRSYQTQPDNIVGKMTMASLDREMQKWETLPRGPVRIRPVSYFEMLPPFGQTVVTPTHGSPLLGLSVAQRSGTVLGAITVSPVQLVLFPGGTQKIEVFDGSPGSLAVQDPSIVKIKRPFDTLVQASTAITDDKERFDVVSLGKLGTTTITASGPISQAFLSVAVKGVSTSFQIEMSSPFTSGWKGGLGGPNSGGTHGPGAWYNQFGMDLGVATGSEVRAAFTGHVTKFSAHIPSNDT